MNKHTFLLFLLLSGLATVVKAQTAIGSSEELAAMNLNGSYYLTADLVIDHWSPVGVFTGELDGRGHCITINRGQVDSNGCGGLFSSTEGATIRNLTVGGDFYAITATGGSLAAVANNTTVYNCETDALVQGDGDEALIGGLIGTMNGGTMYNCSSNATIECKRTGGLVGSALNGATIKNCYFAGCFVFTNDDDNTEIGGIVHTNAGVVENSYVKPHDEGWYLPSIGQLEMMQGCKTFYLLNTKVIPGWGDGECVSISLPGTGSAHCVTNDGKHVLLGFGEIATSMGRPIRFVHDFHGVGFNIGDLIYLNGVKAFVFYINDVGDGGWACASVDDITHVFPTSAPQAISDYFNPKRNIEAMDYDYAHWHDGITVQGDTVPLIPDGYDNSPGKFFTFYLREHDNNRETQVNNLSLKGSFYTSVPWVKQLAYNNQGSINYCYFPFATGTYALTKTGSATRCTRFNQCSAPYNYGYYGARLYKGASVSNYAMVDSLNAWVKAQNDDKYAYWTIPCISNINDNDPIHKYTFEDGISPVNTAVYFGKNTNKIALRYANINRLTDEHKGDNNTIAFYGATDDVSANNVTTPWSAELYITEDARLKGNYQLNCNVVITLDNSDASGFAGANYDWHMVSTPLANAPVGINYSIYNYGGPNGSPSQVKFNNENGYFPLNTPYASWDFYCYDEPGMGWPNFKRKKNDHYHHVTGAHINYNNETNLIPGKGYLWAIGAKTGLQAYGTLNNGDVVREVTNKGSMYSGYNLVGNPYHAYLDFEAFASRNSTTLVQPAYCILDADRQGYISYCSGASDNPVYASRYLSPHQGFFIHVVANGTVTFATDQTLLSADTYFREEKPAYPLVNLMVTDENGRNDYATAELDRPSPGGAPKMHYLQAGNGALAFYQQGVDYSIAFVEGMPKSLPVSFQPSANGTYTLHWEFLNADFDAVRLIDHINGKEVDCLAENQYVFSATTDDFSSRFKLMFTSAAMEDANDTDAPFAFLSGQTLVVEGQGVVELIDLQGRRLKTITVDGSRQDFSIARIASGVYLLRLVNTQHSITQKIIIP